MDKVTIDQLLNIITFIAAISPTKDLLNTSPEYFLEKYERYIGDPTTVYNDKSYQIGLHEVLKKELIEQYKEKWIDNSMVRKDKIRKI